MTTATKLVKTTDIDTLCINTIRTLSLDAVQKANSGHPGLPLGMAPAAYVLWTRFMRHNPKNPKWFPSSLPGAPYNDKVALITIEPAGIEVKSNSRSDLTL